MTLAVTGCSIACAGPFQLLGWEDLGLSAQLVSLAPERAGGAGRQHPLFPATRGLCPLQESALLAWRWAALRWPWLWEKGGNGQVMGNQWRAKECRGTEGQSSSVVAADFSLGLVFVQKILKNQTLAEV